MILLLFLCFFIICGDLRGMIKISTDKPSCCTQSISKIDAYMQQLSNCCKKTVINQLSHLAQNEEGKCIYRFSSTNNCIKQVGKRNNLTFKLSSIGRKTINCDLSIWQQYIVGLPEIQYNIDLDSDCIAAASTNKHDRKTCLPAYPSPKNFKDLLLADYFLFPEDAQNDLISIFDQLDSYEKYLFIKQKLHLSKLIMHDFDEMITNYLEKKELCSINVSNFVTNIKCITDSQYEK